MRMRDPIFGQSRWRSPTENGDCVREKRERRKEKINLPRTETSGERAK